MKLHFLGFGYILSIVAVVASASAENPLEWEFRLSGGLTALSGRVEMRPNSTAPWGTICKDIFKETNFGPIAACNSAGLVGVTQAVYKADFGPGTGPIYLTNVDCTATDTFIQNCSRSALLQVGACVHYEDVGVECSPPITLWQFKMVNGTAPSNGIVIFQPMPSLPWGTVFNFAFWYDGWQFSREVMCRTMGYNTTTATGGDTRLLGAEDDATSFPPYLYVNVNGCPTADISHIGYCSYNQIGASSWTGWSGLVLDCDPPAPTLIGPSITVKLVNGVTASSGMIWISTDAANASVPWVGITAEDVSNNQHSAPTLVQSLTPAQQSVLKAVCTAAGFPNATNPILGKYGSSMGPPTDDLGNTRLIGMGFHCSDSPGTSLGDCTVGPDLKTGYSRGAHYYAGVDCFPTALNFTNWEYRLVDGGVGSNGTIGRVELRPNNTAPWLGICANNEFGSVGVLWTALCRTMGFNTSYGMRSRQPLAGPGLGSTQYYLGFSEHPYCPTVNNDGVTIIANASLQDCSLSPMGMHQCGADGDLTMNCAFPEAILAEMRLVDGGAKVGAGRLEMRPSAAYEWGTVADVWQANMNYDWEVRTAYAICWSLGFLNVTNPTLTMAYGPGNQTQPLWWSLVMCAATDTNFRTCTAQHPFGFTYEFGHSYDLGVDCFPPPFEPIVTLEDGGAPWKGRIMLQYTPFIPIGSVCNDLFKFNHFAWNAACRSAGFLNVTQAKYQSFGPAASTVPISVDDYVCSSSDRFLQNCSHRLYGQHNCQHGEDAGVDCYPPPEETDFWEFRLADGTSATNGRLEMRPGSTFGWGSVCAGPYFNHTVAAWEAACRQVGIMNPPRARWRYFPKGSNTVYLDNVSCNAGDMFLVPNCTMFPLGSYRCSPTEVAGVDCNAPAEVPVQWQFRLVDGRSATSGRLEMRPDAATPYGAVCRRGLTTTDALRIVCRSAGHTTSTRPVVYRPLSPPPPTLPFYLDGAVCNNSTPYLGNCSFAPLYSHACSMDLGDALYVECFPTATPGQTPSATHTLTKGDSRSVASSPSGSARRTKSQPITPTGGWPRARTATLTFPRTKSNAVTQTLQKIHPTRTRTHSTTSTVVTAGGPTPTFPRATATTTMTHAGSQSTSTSAVISATRTGTPSPRSPAVTMTPAISTTPSADHHRPSPSASPLPETQTESVTHASTLPPPPPAATGSAPCPLAAGTPVAVGRTIAAVRGPHTLDLQMPAPVLLASAAPEVFPLPPQMPASALDGGDAGIECRVLTAVVLRCVLSIIDERAVTSAVTVTLAIPTTLITPVCANSIDMRVSLTLLPLATQDDDASLAISIVLTVTTAATQFVFFADPTAYDSMAVVVALVSRCASTADAAMARWARYLLSPLIDLGPSVVGLVHALVPVGAVLLHAAAVVVASARASSAACSPLRRRHAYDQFHCDDDDDVLLPEQQPSTAITSTPARPTLPGLSLFASVAARWRFPGASMAVAVLLYPGAAWALAAHISQQAAGSSSSSNTVTATTESTVGQMALLSVFLVAVPVMVAFCLIRVDTQAVFSDFTTILPPTHHRLHESPQPPLSTSGDTKDHHHYHDDGGRLPSRAATFLKWACVPRGVWGPDASRRSFGPLYGALTGPYPAARWALRPAACAVLLLVCALVGAPTRADACQGLQAAAAVLVLTGTVALGAVTAAIGPRVGFIFATPLTAALAVTGGLSLAVLLAAQAAATSPNSSSNTSANIMRDSADAIKSTAIVINAAAGLLRSLHAFAVFWWWGRRFHGARVFNL